MDHMELKQPGLMVVVVEDVLNKEASALHLGVFVGLGRELDTHVVEDEGVEEVKKIEENFDKKVHLVQKKLREVVLVWVLEMEKHTFA